VKIHTVVAFASKDVLRAKVSSDSDRRSTTLCVKRLGMAKVPTDMCLDVPISV